MTATSSDVGRFRCGAASDRWWWSDHVFLLHGMRPGDVVPTRELLLTHVQRDDRAMVVDTLDRCLAEPEPRACTYRLVDMSGATRRVALAVAGDGDGELTGFLVDVTAALDALLADRVNTELTLALESHAAIDQAKGVLMLTYGVGEDAAFGILKQSSQRCNTRLRELAERVVELAAGGLAATTSELLDEILCGTPGERTPATRPRRLDLRAERCGEDEPVVRVAGSVDLSNRDELADAITLAMLGASAGGRLTVDLRGLGRVGPAVADVLTTAMRRGAAHGITLTVVGGAGDVAVPDHTHRPSVASHH